MEQENYGQEIKELKAVTGVFKGCFLAGGAITSKFSGKKIRDYDLYFKSREAFTEAVEAAYDDGWWCLSVTDRAITFIENNETIFQLMCFDWFESAQAIFDRFDFTCCMAAIDLETDEFFRDPDFIRDVARRRLQFNHGTAFPLGSAMRVRKYQDRGYSIDDSEYLKILIACLFKKVECWDDLKKQIGGQYGEAMMLDTSKDFTLPNAIESLEQSLIAKPKSSMFQVAESSKQALDIIFGPVNKAA